MTVRELTEAEANVIDAAMELAAMRRALDLGNPAQPHIARAERDLDKACADLAAEGDGTWRRP